jgi:hypothetical protein
LLPPLDEEMDMRSLQALFETFPPGFAPEENGDSDSPAQPTAIVELVARLRSERASGTRLLEAAVQRSHDPEVRKALRGFLEDRYRLDQRSAEALSNLCHLCGRTELRGSDGSSELSDLEALYARQARLMLLCEVLETALPHVDDERVREHLRALADELRAEEGQVAEWARSECARAWLSRLLSRDDRSQAA